MAIFKDSFVSTAETKYLAFPTNVDGIRIVNQTVIDAGGADTGVIFEWDTSMAADTALQYVKLAADDSISPDMIASGGITAYDSSSEPVGAIVSTITAISAAATPVVTAIAHGLVDGDVIRLINPVGAQQLGGLDFTVTWVSADTFTLTNMAQIVAGTTASWRPLKFAPMFYPSTRVITAITAATSAVVTFSVDHDYVVGQQLKLSVPTIFDMVEMNGLTGTVTAVTDATVTLDIDSSAFTAFAWPLTADVAGGFDPAQAIPTGKDGNSDYMSVYNPVRNTATRGLILKAGTTSPAGDTGDVIKWVAYVADEC